MEFRLFNELYHESQNPTSSLGTYPTAFRLRRKKHPTNRKKGKSDRELSSDYN
jgi:hypothetical protein